MDISVNAISVIDQHVKGNKTFVVEFFAPWCGPCKVYGPTLHKYCSEKKVPLYTINGDMEDNTVKQVMDRYHISAFPTTLVFKLGKGPHKIVGANMNEVKSLLG